MELQTQLLRILQEQGSSARILASTSKHLPSEVTKGTFRADLFYRLNVFSIVVPPLRERRDDVQALTRFAIAQFSAKNAKAPARVSADALRQLYVYDWPGNVRELFNIVEQACLVCASGEIRPVDLPEEIREADASGFDEDSSPGLSANATGEGGELKVRPLKDLEREMMIAALKETTGNVSEAARRLGIGRATFYRRAQAHGLNRDDGFPG